MISSIEMARYFNDLHVKGKPIVLPNAWDVASSAVLESSGVKAIATSSWSIAKSLGFNDGEEIGFSVLIGRIEEIIKGTKLPVTVDIETGYANNSSILKRNVALLIKMGVVGVNIEDKIIGHSKLRTIAEQCQVISSIRAESDTIEFPLFINARTDAFFQQSSKSDEALLDEVIARGESYVKSGANGLFFPGLSNDKIIKKLTSHFKCPINIMIDCSNSSRIKCLSELGVSRISFGPHTYINTMSYFESLCKKFISKD